MVVLNLENTYSLRACNTLWKIETLPELYLFTIFYELVKKLYLKEYKVK